MALPVPGCDSFRGMFSCGSRFSCGRLRTVSATDEVSGTAASVQQRFRAWRIDLLSEAIHVDFDQVRERVERFVPHMLGDFSAPDDPPSVPCQKFEQSVLFGGDRDGMARPRYALSSGIQYQILNRDFRQTHFGRSTEQRAQAGQQFAK